MADNWLFIGLGNPGATYELTRHNMGHLVIDGICDEHGVNLANHKNIADVATTRLGVLPGGIPGPQVRLATLRCYMNVSGNPTKQLVDFFHIDPDHLVVIHDDLDLPEHTLRLKRGGGEGGHNGLKSISQSLGTKNYCRLRVGIGRPPGRQNPADYVLSRLRDRDEWAVTVARAGDVIEQIVTDGFAKTQQQLHSAG